MDNLYFNIWTKKDMLKIASDQLNTAGYGTYNATDLVIEAISAVAQLRDHTGASDSKTNNPNSGGQITFAGARFCLGQVPEMQLVGVNQQYTFEPEGYSVGAGNRTDVYIGYVDILAPHKEGFGWSNNDAPASDTFATYTGNLCQVHEIAREHSKVMVGTSMALGVPFQNATSPQGFIFHGFRISVMS